MFKNELNFWNILGLDIDYKDFIRTLTKKKAINSFPF